MSKREISVIGVVFNANVVRRMRDWVDAGCRVLEEWMKPVYISLICAKDKGWGKRMVL